MVLLPEHGNLGADALPRLLLDLHRSSFTGTIRVTRERVEKAFSFRDGSPVFAESNLASESLGIQLMDSGAISRADYNRVVRHVEERQCKEGAALLDLGLIAPRELFVALKKQVRARLVECFSWTSGAFTVEPEATPPEGSQPFRTDVFGALQEGIETHWGSERVIASLHPHMGQIACRTARVARLANRLESDRATQAVIDAMDGSQTLWKVVKCAVTPRALATLWLLDALEAIEYREPEATEAAAGRDPGTLEIVFSDAPPAEEPRSAPRASRKPKRPRQPPADAPDPALAEKLREEIAARFAGLGEIDYYDLLGVSRTTEIRAIKQRYLEAAKSYHPDALARLGIVGEDRKRAGRVFAEIGRAYAVLSKPDRRREYDATLAGEDLGVDADQIATAETLYRKGEILLRAGNFKGALEFLKPAVEIYPDECDYQAALGWALYKKMPSEPEQAKQHLQKAAELRSDDATVLFRLGVVLRTLGETVAASTLLNRAKALDPSVS